MKFEERFVFHACSPRSLFIQGCFPLRLTAKAAHTAKSRINLHIIHGLINSALGWYKWKNAA